MITGSECDPNFLTFVLRLRGNPPKKSPQPGNWPDRWWNPGSAQSPTFFVTSPTPQLILQPFRRFTYVTTHSPTLPLLHLRHSSLSNPSVASPTPQLILQPFRCFTYVTAHSPTLLSLLLRHWLFTYVTWRAAHGPHCIHKWQMTEVAACTFNYELIFHGN